MKKLLLILLLTFTSIASEISVQVLGSGGPEGGERASSSYLIKEDGKALILIDFGGGAFLRFGQAGARIEDLRAVLFTHLHIDHVVELPALMKAGYFSERGCKLEMIGPKGNAHFPGFNEFIQLQFGEKGSYRYMSDILTAHSDSFSLKIYEGAQTLHFKGFDITALEVQHGIVPALAYRIDIKGKSIVFSGDTAAKAETLTKLSKDADILIAHHAIPQMGYDGVTELHMKPSRIAEVASQAKVKMLLLSHRMHRTLGYEKPTEEIISQKYKGKIIWAEDLMEIKIP